MTRMRPDFEKATEFIWLNARLLDRLRFAQHFLHGSKDHVVNALCAYQNPDGGFGNALEPDLRTPASQPQPTEVALYILDELDTFPDSIAQSTCDFLATITTDEGGVPFVLPTAIDYPCAPWWRTHDPHPPAALNPTAGIVALLHKHNVQHTWRERATDFCWRALARDEPRIGYDYKAILAFLASVPDRRRAQAAFDKLAAELLNSDQLTLHPATPGHVFMPLDFAPMPGDALRRCFSSAVIEQHLDALVARQQPDGGWPITWTPPSTLAEHEWRGAGTVNTLRLLEANGRLG